MKQKISRWLDRILHTKYAAIWFSFLFILESVLFFPLDLVIALFAYKKPKQLHFHTALGAASSTVGAWIGYLIGAFAWDTIGHRLITATISAEKFYWFIAWYAKLHAPIIIITGLLPLPFKLFTISAGFCSLPLFSFLVCILITRWIRYLLVALCTTKFGHHITKFW